MNWMVLLNLDADVVNRTRPSNVPASVILRDQSVVMKAPVGRTVNRSEAPPTAAFVQRHLYRGAYYEVTHLGLRSKIHWRDQGQTLPRPATKPHADVDTGNGRRQEHAWASRVHSQSDR